MVILGKNNLFEKFNKDQFLIIKEIIPKDLISRATRKLYKINQFFNGEFDENGFSGSVYDFGNQISERYEIGIIAEKEVEKILGSPLICTGFQLRMDTGGNSSELLNWHRDTDYYQNYPSKGVVAWIPLREVNEHNGTIELIKGQFKKEDFTPFQKEYVYEGRKPHHVWEVNPGDHKSEIIQMEPGDLLLFSVLNPHKSIPNKSDITRFTIQTRFFPMFNTDLDREQLEKNF